MSASLLCTLAWFCELPDHADKTINFDNNNAIIVPNVAPPRLLPDILEKLFLYLLILRISGLVLSSEVQLVARNFGLSGKF